MVTTFMLVHAREPSPKPSATGEHLLTLRATSVDAGPCEVQCKVWVNEAGRLRIERIEGAVVVDEA
jgi:hypothetical protein